MHPGENKKPTNGCAKQNAVPLKLNPRQHFRHVFRDNLRPETASNVMPGVAAVWMQTKELILGQTVLEIYEPLTS